MTYAEIIAAWNTQADHMNQWPVLSEQEKVEWAWKYALEEAAKVCDEKSDHMGKRAAKEDCDADDAISLRSTAWIVKNCATAIRAMKDKPCGDKRDRWQEPQDQQPEPEPAGSFI